MKPFYKKWWFWFLAFIAFGAIIGITSENNTETASTTAQGKKVVDEQKENKEQEKKKISTIKKDVNKELNFKLFDVKIEKVKVYEKKGKLLADIKMWYRNRDYDYGDKKTFYTSTLFEAKQDDEMLHEINNAWDPVLSEKRSDVFFPNAAGGLTSLNLTYELIDRETPLTLEFTPTTEIEGTKKVTIELKE